MYLFWQLYPLVANRVMASQSCGYFENEIYSVIFPPSIIGVWIGHNDRLNEEEGDWLGWFVGKGVAHAGAQLTRIACGAT